MATDNLLGEERSAMETYWERVATTRWGRHITKIERELINFGIGQVSQAGTALDVGCEGGRWSKMLSDAHWQVICTDVNEKTLAVCQERIPNSRCILTSAGDEQLPASSGSVRVVLLIEVWAIAHSPWFLREANRVLELGGILVITVPNRWSWRGVLSSVRGDAATWYPGTFRRWKQKARSAGFEILKADGYAWSPFRRESDSRLVALSDALRVLLPMRRMTSLSPWVAVVAKKTS